MDRFMQRNTLIQRLGRTVWVSFTGFLTLAALWLGLFGLSTPTAIATPIAAEAGLTACPSESLADKSAASELAGETNCQPPAKAEENVNVLVVLESQEPSPEKLDLQTVDTIKIQTEKALQLVEVNAKQVFVQAKEVAEKASSKAEDAFDGFIVWLKSFSS